MVNKTSILSFLKEHKNQFLAEYNITKIGLFGSYAIGNATSKSDIDIIVEFKPNTSKLTEKKAALKQTIQNQFNNEVDICREKYLKPYFKSYILAQAIYV